MMKTDCKKWKSLLCITTAAALFAIVPLSTQAADAQVRLMDDPSIWQETTPDKMNSTDRAFVLAMTAGAANILNAKISVLSDETAAKLMDIKELQDEPKKEESTLVMAKVNEYVNIRSDASQEAEIIGVLYKDCGGNVIEKGEEWSKIKSGDAVGWIKNQYLYFGEEAEKLASDIGNLTAYSTTETLRIRKEPSLEAGIVGLLANGQAVEAIAEEGDWVKVSYEGTTGFVSAEYVRVELNIDTAETMEKIREREAAAAAKAKAEAEAKAKRIQQKEAVLATASELEIMAAIIQCEAGSEPYEGQLAVGSVVMNRVRCGGYPNTITDVIYASGQFSPAGNGRLESVILGGKIKASCMQAAVETINGLSNVGDALHFRRYTGQPGIVIGNHVFW